MKNRLSYYSVVLLAGLAVTSVLVFAVDPFSSSPNGASAATQSSTVSTSGSPAVTNGTSPLSPGQGSLNGGNPYGDHGYGDRDGGRLGSGVHQDGPSITTTTTATIYSQNE